MKRRQFISLLGGAAAAWPLAAKAQQKGVSQRIGVLIAISESDPEAQNRVNALSDELRQLGWIDGQNTHIKVHFAGGDTDRARVYATELVRWGAQVIVANSSPILSAVQRQSSTIPIVFVQVADPVGGGFVESLSHPGGNITGFTTFEYSIGAKWLELLKDIAPSMRRAGVLRDPTFAAPAAQFGAIQAMASSVRMQVSPIGVRNPGEIERAITAFAQNTHGGLIVLPSPLTAVHRDLIIELAARNALPTVYPYQYFSRRGGLISYGPDLADLFRRAASYVDRILKGEKPADLPVQAPTKYELVINLKTAKALGLDVPPMVLARADEVIE